MKVILWALEAYYEAMEDIKAFPEIAEILPGIAEAHSEVFEACTGIIHDHPQYIIPQAGIVVALPKVMEDHRGVTKTNGSRP